MGLIQANLLRPSYATWRVQCDVTRLDDPLAKGRRIIFAFWHGKYVPIFAAFAGRRGCVFTSVSRRGEVISEICRRFGYTPVMIPDHGADESYETMKEALAAHDLCGIAADGPLGPHHVVKRGVVKLASELGFEILTCSVASRPARVFADRWDRMEIPKPFARVCIAIGEPIAVPAGLDGDDVHDWCGAVRHELERADDAATEMLG